MPFGLGSTLRSCALLAIAGLALAGCGAGAAGDGSSPQRAVETFLAPLPKAPLADLGPDEQRDRAIELWKEMCDRVDPAIRKGLRFDGEATMSDAHTACGAIVVLMVMETGETSRVPTPDTISGTPRSAVTHGDTSIVTVDVRYGRRPSAAGPRPPARATVKVLVVKRDGRWWVATPGAFNPNYASRGGLTEPQLRRSYAQLLAAAR